MFQCRDTHGELLLATPPRVNTQSSLSLYEGLVRENASESEKDFSIDLIVTGAQRASVCSLINEKYGWRGYGSNHDLGANGHCSTFVALLEGSLVGTLSLTIDNGDQLASEASFPDFIAQFRSSPGVKLCELTKFAFSSKSTPMNILASLFHTIFIYGTTRYECTDLLIEVNPRHIRFYETMLGFSKVGTMRTNCSVGAPSQLMRLNVCDIGKYIQEHAGCRAPSGRSLYPYFLTAAQECLIHERMADLGPNSRFDILNAS
ncbi:acetyltransferase [Altererythrobacter aurantiacus]|uniref:Acetyltransferase n=1 Tax=Parapontixanthobacter aurantiacus TaxID=1463599 RepID=A0A844ZBE6_9SPHN|nr:acetyltransferase [Parapontixanthobacter aurantiacus]MXO85235.1 acetyltransferase [Parapontixanthobacter aurantiacus]